MTRLSPIFAYVALQSRLDVVHESMVRFMGIYIVRNISTQIADHSLIFVMIKFDVQR